MSIAVLIPCYNESQTIAKVVAEYKAALPEADIYVYDNNSKDGTDEIARAAGAIVRYERKQGKGNVIRAMFREIDADCYIMTDGDDTYPADKAREMADLVLRDGADMVVGDRLSGAYYTENKRQFHNAGNAVVPKIVNRLFHGNVPDVFTGGRAFSPLFVKTFPVLSQGFEIEAEMTIHALDKNMNIRQVPIGYRDRPEGSESKLNTVRDGVKVLIRIAMLYKDYQPLRFFGLIAVAFFAVCLALFIFVLAVYFQTDVLKIPTLFGAGFLFIAGAISLVCGLVLNTVVGQNRQNFELSINLFDLLLKQRERNA